MAKLLFAAAAMLALAAGCAHAAVFPSTAPDAIGAVTPGAANVPVIRPGTGWDAPASKPEPAAAQPARVPQPPAAAPPHQSPP